MSKKVRVKAVTTSAAFADTHPAAMGKKFLIAPGYNLVGIVDKIGPMMGDTNSDGSGGNGDKSIQVGDLVADLTVLVAHSEYDCVPSKNLVQCPPSINPVKAVAGTLAHMTAHQMLHCLVWIQRGQRMLVHGASSAVSTAPLQ